MVASGVLGMFMENENVSYIPSVTTVFRRRHLADVYTCNFTQLVRFAQTMTVLQSLNVNFDAADEQ